MSSASCPFIAGGGSDRVARLPLHTNPGLEIVYVELGHLLWEVEGECEKVLPGHCFFTFPWENHGSLQEYEPGNFLHWVILRFDGESKPEGSWSFHKDIGFTQQENERIRRVLLDATHRSIMATDGMATLLPRLVLELKSGDPWLQPATSALARLLLVELVRCIEADDSNRKVLPGVFMRVDRSIAMIRERCSEPWTLAAMSSLAGLSRTRFSNLLNEITGDSPGVFLRRMRVNKAQRLLRETSMSVTEVALESGFQTSQHFARIFKAFSGMTAIAYRDAHLKRR